MSTHEFPISSALHYFLYVWVSIWFYFPPVCRTAFNNYFRTGVIDQVLSIFVWKSVTLPSLLKDIFAGYRILCILGFFPLALWRCFHFMVLSYHCSSKCDVSFSSGDLIMMCISVIFFVFSLVGVCWTSWICGFRVFIKFGNILAIISLNIAWSLTLSPPFGTNTNYTYNTQLLLWHKVTEALFIFVQSIFSLCFMLSDFLFYIKI